jgi:alpha-N-arabinofuranosidase
MLLTPTFHVFEMFAAHQDSTMLPSDLSCDDYRLGQEKIPGLSASASRDRSNKIHVTLCNLNPNTPAEVSCVLQGASAKVTSGRVLTASSMQAHNTFESPEAVKPSSFQGFRATSDGFSATLPERSVVVLELE